MAIIVYILNIADLIFTINLVKQYGVDIEANPFGRWLFSHPDILGFYKVILVGFLCGILFANRTLKLARIGSWVLLVAFSTLISYHIYIYIKLHQKR